MSEAGALRHVAIAIGECRSYVKILDVASLGLDLLVRETGLRRGSVDHFLLGY